MADDANNKPTDDGQGSAKQPAVKSWTEYVALHPEAAPLHEAEVSQLTATLEKERGNASRYAQQLREAAEHADDATKAKLTELAAAKDAEVASVKAELEFNRAAIAAGVRNDLIGDAWVIAQAAGITDIAKLKAAKPWLFDAPKTGNANGGAGGRQPVSSLTPGQQINNRIRQAFGYTPD